MKKLAILFCLAVPLMAESKAPKITDAQRAAYWKSQAALAQVRAQKLQAVVQGLQAQAMAQAAIKDMQTTCGDKYELQPDPGGDPVCIAKPETKKK